jgi:hypothetical protein
MAEEMKARCAVALDPGQCEASMRGTLYQARVAPVYCQTRARDRLTCHVPACGRALGDGLTLPKSAT